MPFVRRDRPPCNGWRRVISVDSHDGLPHASWPCPDGLLLAKRMLVKCADLWARAGAPGGGWGRAGGEGGREQGIEGARRRVIRRRRRSSQLAAREPLSRADPRLEEVQS